MIRYLVEAMVGNNSMLTATYFGVSHLRLYIFALYGIPIRDCRLMVWIMDSLSFLRVLFFT